MAAITRLGTGGGPAAATAGSVYADYAAGPPDPGSGPTEVTAERKSTRFTRFLNAARAP